MCFLNLFGSTYRWIDSLTLNLFCNVKGENLDDNRDSQNWAAIDMMTQIAADEELRFENMTNDHIEKRFTFFSGHSSAHKTCNPQSFTLSANGYFVVF